MRKLRSIRQKIADNNRIAAEEVERITQWQADANAPHERDAQFFEGLLIEYARNEREQNNRKSIKLPHGTILSRKGADKIVVTDSEGFMKWARENDRADLIRVKEEPSISAIKEAFPPKESPDATAEGFVITEDGEIVVGLTTQPSQVSYSVEVEL